MSLAVETLEICVMPLASATSAMARLSSLEFAPTIASAPVARGERRGLARVHEVAAGAVLGEPKRPPAHAAGAVQVLDREPRPPQRLLARRGVAADRREHRRQRQRPGLGGPHGASTTGSMRSEAALGRSGAPGGARGASEGEDGRQQAPSTSGAIQRRSYTRQRGAEGATDTQAGTAASETAAEGPGRLLGALRRRAPRPPGSPWPQGSVR